MQQIENGFLARTLALAWPLLACSSCGGDSMDDPPVDPPAATVSAVFVLGDSWSDVGNAAAAADALIGQPIAPPTVGLCNPADVFALSRSCEDLFYGKSRVSDGPVAVEALAARVAVGTLQPSYHLVSTRPTVGTNYAVASAKARDSGPENLGQQVDRLVLDHNPLPATAVYVVMIGGNDAIDAVQLAGNATAPTQASLEVAAAATDAIVAAVERLAMFGARHIVIGNVPDLAALPVLRDRPLLAGAVADAFNVALETRLVALDAKTRAELADPPELLRFDLRAALRTAQRTIGATGGDAVEACFDSDLYLHSSTAERAFASDCAPAAAGSPPRFDRFVFWDDLHPTGAAHALLGAALIEVSLSGRLRP